MNNHQVAERYVKAAVDQDLSVLTELAHPDIVVTYPQSGETIRGRDNYLAMLSSYPGGLVQLDHLETQGTPESIQVISSPFGLPRITVSSAGNIFFMEGVAQYPDDGIFNLVGFIEVRDGMVTRETSYFAAQFDPPAWRASFVEQ